MFTCVFCTQGSAISDQLRDLAARRTDIFGSGAEETVIGKMIGEEEKKDTKSLKVGGHTHWLLVYTHTLPFNGRWSRTTRVGRYQKKHSPTHTHPDYRTSFITFLHLSFSLTPHIHLTILISAR